MTETIREYEIRNVAGIEKATLRLRPGCNVLRGKNAAGKTSAMRSIARAAGGETELERRDGVDHGEVRGPGVHLRVGKVVRRTGEAELALADTTPLSTLVDPQIKGTDAAARARLRALVQLLGLRVDDAALDVLTHGDDASRDWLRDEVQAEAVEDLMVAAEKLRGRLHAWARAQEERAEQASGRAQSARERSEAVLEALGGEANLVDTPVDTARETLDAGIRQHERALAQCEAREALEERQSMIRSSIGVHPDVAAAEEDLRVEDHKLAEEDATIASLEQQLAEAKGRRMAQQERRSAASVHLGQTRAALAKWEDQQRILTEPLEGPTRDEVETLRHDVVHSAEEALRAAGRSWEVRVSRDERKEALATHEAAEREAGRLRALAADIPQRLGKILAGAGASDLTVIDGRLHATVDGKVLDWERRLSDGQRVRLALGVAAQVYHGVVPLSGAYWTSLDPENRAEFAALAKEKGLYVLTEEPADGELRVESVG